MVSCARGELAMDEAGRFQRKQGMRVGVIADFVSGGGDLARDFGQAANIGADLKERGGRAVAGQDFEQLRSRFAGPVVEGEGDGAARALEPWETEGASQEQEGTRTA